MAIRDLNFLKQKFETGAVPSQQDFHDLLDSFFNKLSTIGMNNVNGLQYALDGKMTIAHAQEMLDLMSSGVDLLYPGDVTSPPTANKRYAAAVAGDFANLKLSNGTMAPLINVTAHEVSSSHVYLDFNINSNSWVKKIISGGNFITQNTAPSPTLGAVSDVYLSSGGAFYKKVSETIWSWIFNFQKSENKWIPTNLDLVNITSSHANYDVLISDRIELAVFGDGSKFNVMFENEDIVMPTITGPYIFMKLKNLTPLTKYYFSATVTYSGSGDIRLINSSQFLPSSGGTIKVPFGTDSYGVYEGYLRYNDGAVIGTLENIRLAKINIVKADTVLAIDSLKLIQPGSLGAPMIEMSPGVSSQTPAHPNTINYDGTDLYLTNSEGITKKIITQ